MKEGDIMYQIALVNSPTLAKWWQIDSVSFPVSTEWENFLHSVQS